MKIGTSRDDDGIYQTNTPSSTNLSLDGAYTSSGTATLADGNIKIGIASNDDGLAQYQKTTGNNSSFQNFTENGDIDYSSGRYALTD